MNTKTTILPAGFYDILPADAAKEYHTLANVLEALRTAGYAYIRAPLLEFEESLLLHADDKLKAQTFRVMDPESGQMMGMRADITPQIARIAETRLNNEPRPLQLSYNGQVVRASSEGTGNRRQWTQSGLEYIGDAECSSVAAVVRTAISALQSTGVNNITVDFTLPMLLPALIKQGKVNAKDAVALSHLVAYKDIDGLRAHDALIGGILADILATSGPAKQALDALNTFDFPSDAIAKLKHLASVIDQLDDVGATLTIDPLEMGGFDYYDGVAFAIFAEESQSELGRGGCYTLPRTGEPAVGCSFNMEAVTALL